MSTTHPHLPTKQSPSVSASGRVDPQRIQPGMPVVCSKDGQFAEVDHMEGNSSIKLKRDTNGVHHYIPLAWVTKIDDKVHLDRPGDQAMREWTTTPTTSYGPQ